MEWTNDMILEFLDEYEKEPVIWDSTHEHYKNRKEVHDAWQRIVDELDWDCEISELKKKKDSLLASFRTCWSKVKVSRLNARKPGDVFQPSWFAFDKMASFLKNKNMPTDVKPNVTIDELDLTVSSDDPLLIKKPQEMKSRLQVQTKKRKNNDTPIHNVDDQMSGKSLRRSVDRPMDDYQVFGDYVASEFRFLKSEKSKMLLRRRIQRAILEASEDDCMENSDGDSSKSINDIKINHRFSLPSKCNAGGIC